MEKVKIISARHVDGNYAAELVEEKVNAFLKNDLPKIGGKVKDIKLTACANSAQAKYLVAAIIIYEV